MLTATIAASHGPRPTVFKAPHFAAPPAIESRAAARTAISDNREGIPVYPASAQWLAKDWIVLDLIGIAFSGIMILFVLYRAMMLDRLQPWFETPPDPAPAPETAPTPPGRRLVRSRGGSR